MLSRSTTNSAGSRVVADRICSFTSETARLASVCVIVGNAGRCEQIRADLDESNKASTAFFVLRGLSTVDSSVN